MKNKETFVDYEKCSKYGATTYKARCPYCGKENIIVFCEDESCEKEAVYDTCEHFKDFGAGSFWFVNIQ